MAAEKLNEALNMQLKEELKSAYLYWAMAADFEAKNQKGFAGWFKAQAGEEMIHVMKIYGFLYERLSKAELPALEKPQASWSSPLEAFEAALKHEKFITGCIHSLYKQAKDLGDYAGEVFLQWFVNEQVEEEANADEVVQKLQTLGNQPMALYLLDKELGARKPPFSLQG